MGKVIHVAGTPYFTTSDERFRVAHGMLRRARTEKGFPEMLQLWSVQLQSELVAKIPGGFDFRPFDEKWCLAVMGPSPVGDALGFPSMGSTSLSAHHVQVWQARWRVAVAVRDELRPLLAAMVEGQPVPEDLVPVVASLEGREGSLDRWALCEAMILLDQRWQRWDSARRGVQPPAPTWAQRFEAWYEGLGQ